MHVFSLQSSDDSSTLVYVTSFPYEESRMTTVDFITALFSKVDEQLHAIPKHPEAPLWPSEVVTLGLLHTLKGGGNRALYRWLTRDSRPSFTRLPGRRGDQDPIPRDLVDPPCRGSQHEDLASPRLVHHLLVELADAGAVREEHAEQASVGDRAAADDRDPPRALSSPHGP